MHFTYLYMNSSVRTHWPCWRVLIALESSTNDILSVSSSSAKRADLHTIATMSSHLVSDALTLLLDAGRHSTQALNLLVLLLQCSATSLN